jgi:hypothetical protein
VALVVLVGCCGGAWLLGRDDEPDGAPRRAGGSASAAASPTVEPVSPEAYQAALTAADDRITDALRRLAAATTPKAAGEGASAITTAAESAGAELAELAPPEPVADAHQALLTALADLASAAGDTQSAAEGREVCVGSSATALLSRSEAIDEVRAAAADLAAADPARAYTFGGKLPKETRDSVRRAKNGMYVKRTSGGSGQLRITNGGSADALLSLVKSGTKKPATTVYLRAKGKYTVTGVRDGTYQIYLSNGVDWDTRAKRFTRECRFSRLNSAFKFTTTSRQYTVWEIKLTVAGGNETATGVDPEEFPGG